MEQTEQVQKLNELVALATEHKNFVGKLKEEIASVGAVSAETKTALTTINERIDKVQTQADAIDAKIAEKKFGGGGGDTELKSIGQLITEDPKFLERVQEAGGIHGNDPIRLRFAAGVFDGRKSVITTGGVGTGTSGVQMPQRLFDDPLELAIQELRVRDLLSVRQMTTGNSFDYPLQNLRTNAPSPQVEGEAKAESTYGWTSQIGTIKTIAHYTNVSKQSLDDIPWMRRVIDGELRYGLLEKEEQEILAGSGVGQHLNGLITAATAYDSGKYNVSGDTKLDKLRHMKLQVRLAGKATFAPDGIVMNPRDMHDIELLKTEEGAANKGLYIVGDPKTGPSMKLIWGLPVVESDSITYGTFLVGAFKRAATLIDRMVATVDISFEHDLNYVKNLATILAEERIGLAITRPAAFVVG